MKNVPSKKINLAIAFQIHPTVELLKITPFQTYIFSDYSNSLMLIFG